jgi:hypothetical protein
MGTALAAALVAKTLRGALPPVDLRAVCFVLAILSPPFFDLDVPLILFISSAWPSSSGGSRKYFPFT